MTLSRDTLKTIDVLQNNIYACYQRGHVAAGWVPSGNIFNDDPLTQAEADKMNQRHDLNIKEHNDIVYNLLQGMVVPEYLDSDY